MNYLRRRDILERIRHGEFLSSREIAGRWNVSLATVRRDIDAITGVGLAVRIRGGIRRASDSAPPEVQVSPGIEVPLAMLRRAASLARPGMTIGIAAGYAAVGMAHQLAQLTGVTFITNSFAAADALMEMSDGTARAARIILLPGIVDSSRSTSGPPCVDALRELRIDATYFSASGFDPRAGAFSDALSASEVARAFAESSRMAVALAESSRWLTSSPAVLPASLFDTIVADFQPDEVARLALTSAGTALMAA